MKHAILLVNLSLVILGGMVLAPHFAYAGDDLGLGQVAREAKLDTVKDVPKVLGQVLGAVLALVGIMFFLLMLYGGITWMTAHGNEEQASKALKILVSAIAGLIIVLASYTLVKFVFGSVGGGGDLDSSRPASLEGPPNCLAIVTEDGKTCQSNTDCPAGGRCDGNVCRTTCAGSSLAGQCGYRCTPRPQCSDEILTFSTCPAGQTCCVPAAAIKVPEGSELTEPTLTGLCTSRGFNCVEGSLCATREPLEGCSRGQVCCSHRRPITTCPNINPGRFPEDEACKGVTVETGCIVLKGPGKCRWDSAGTQCTCRPE